MTPASRVGPAAPVLIVAVPATIAFLLLAAPRALAQPRDSEFDRLYQAGVDAYHLGKQDEARALFEKASARHPELPGPHRQLAAVAFAQRRYADCIVSARRALEVKPDSEMTARVRELHGECRQALGRPPLRVALEDHQGALSVTSNVDGAVVAVNGLTLGPAPVEPRPMAARAIAIEATSTGYLTARTRVTVLPGVVTDVHLVLARDPGYRPPTGVVEQPGGKGWLRVVPGAAAEVRVDRGEVALDARGRMRLAPGVHEVSVEAAGYVHWRRRVRIAEGQLTTLEVDLVSTDANRKRRAMAWGALGLAAAAAATGVALSLAEIRTYEDAQDLWDREIERPDNVPLDESGQIEPVGTRGDIDDLHDRGRRLRTWALVSYGVAAVALGAGGFLLIRSRSRERPGLPPPFAIAPLSGGGAAVSREIRW